MKRRTFVRTLGLGTFALSWQPGTSAATALFSPFSVWRQIQLFQQKLSAHWRSTVRVAAEDLHTLVEATNCELAESGFFPDGKGVYFTGTAGNFCFYPVIWQHKASNTSEMLVPVFHRDNTGQWKHQRTLNSFQVEALTLAAAALQEKGLPLYPHLLPASKFAVAEQPQRFLTQEGSVFISTNMKGGKAITTCEVKGRESVYYQEKFESRHTLCH
ncbi:MAG: hypothetical protein IPL65_09995 [Lewinellaceae bacterium]|nr:hypothetical protein [Lewinellaceae bacterium]